jgi:CheY-like chemotaxis protein
VLLVEDNPTDVFVIKEVLDRCGLNLRVRSARDGQDALTYLQDLAGNESSLCPALVLLDLNLPKISGFEVLEVLRSGPRCNRTPVIIVSSSKAQTDRAAAERLGADAYFEKPADLKAYQELGPVIMRFLRPDKEGEGT